MSLSRCLTALGAGIALAAGVLAAGTAVAQNYNAADAVSSSRLGSMSCAEFTAASPRHRDDIVRHMAMSAPMQSLATPIGPSIDPETGRLESQPHNGAAVEGTPLTAGQLIAACQAATPRTTLRSAFSRFSTAPSNTFTIGR